MSYVSVHYRVFSLLLLFILTACAGVDPYNNPFYKGDEAASGEDVDRSISRSPERRSIDSIVRTRDDGPDSGSESDKSFSSMNSEQAATAATEGHAQDESILLSAGPNPYLANAQTVDTYANEQFSRAIAAMQSQDWSGAEQMLLELTTRQPDLSSPWQQMGVAQMQQGKIDEARQSFEKAIASNEANQEAYNQLGLLYRKQGQFAKAEASYQRAIGVWPAYPAVRLNLGILYELYVGDLAKALQQYTIYQSLIPEPDRKVKGWISDLKRRLQVSAT